MTNQLITHRLLNHRLLICVNPLDKSLNILKIIMLLVDGIFNTKLPSSIPAPN